MSLKNITLGKRSHTKGVCVAYDSIYIKFSEKVKLVQQGADRKLPGAVGGAVKEEDSLQRATRSLCTDKNIPSLDFDGGNQLIALYIGILVLDVQLVFC
jgi:hypothetical protein